LNISEKIKKVLKDKGIKPDKFSADTGVSVDRVRNLSQGKIKKLLPHEKDAIYNAYGVNQKWWDDETLPTYAKTDGLIFFPGDNAEQPYVVAESMSVKTPMSSTSPVKATLLQPSAEWIVLTTIAISEADWLPDSVKQDRSAQVTIALKLYQLLVMHLGENDAKWEWMMNNREALQHALHFVYDLEKIATLNIQK
jgi:hypothetical protein